jgi:hypothetical protein
VGERVARETAASAPGPKPVGKKLGTFGIVLLSILACAIAWLVSSFIK